MDHQDWDTVYMGMNKELKKKELKEKPEKKIQILILLKTSVFFLKNMQSI